MTSSVSRGIIRGWPQLDRLHHLTGSALRFEGLRSATRGEIIVVVDRDLGYNGSKVVIMLMEGWKTLLTPEVEGRRTMEDSVKFKSFFGRVVVFGVVLACVLYSVAFGQPWDGNGVEGDPYQIWDANDMQAIGADSNYWDAHFILCADIDLSGYTGDSFNVIGNTTTKFTGGFDGNGKIISNFNYTSTGVHYISLFGYIDGADTEIKNLGMFNPSVHTGTGDGAASLINRKSNGTVSDCYAINGNISGKFSCGGLVGFNERGTISNCCFTGSVSGHGWTGGFVGRNDATFRMMITLQVR
jgi:hypothetical protein